MTTGQPRPYYWDYLQLDQLLGCQRPLSGQPRQPGHTGRDGPDGEGGTGSPPAHDEHLFIVVHQAFEL